MLIGLNGFKSAGKDTVGDYLVEKYGFTKASFAALLKQSAAALFNIDACRWEYLKNDDQAKVILEDPRNFSTVSMTAREFLQRYGTESHRDVFGYDFWVEQAFKNAIGFKNAVFTDARFENELATIRERDGFNIQIVRDSTDSQSGGHASEVRPDVGLIDIVLHNDSTKDRLYEQVDEAMGALGI